MRLINSRKGCPMITLAVIGPDREIGEQSEQSSRSSNSSNSRLNGRRSGLAPKWMAHKAHPKLAAIITLISDYYLD
ncbi:hypothetical protein TYRP_001390 [Tyrophagus putrescentiae]|nr:hypothetical protein TYRP_001390 [Tyrophagus putrescentiae]